MYVTGKCRRGILHKLNIFFISISREVNIAISVRPSFGLSVRPYENQHFKDYNSSGNIIRNLILMDNSFLINSITINAQKVPEIRYDLHNY